MTRYDYQCPKCSFKEEYIHSMKDSPIYFCPKCNGQKIAMERLISFNKNNFIIKGGSASKDWKEERYRVKRSNEMGVRQVERWGSGQKLKPNVAGVETETWNDAAKMAKEAGLSEDSYTPMIEKEKRISKTSGIDDVAWKTAKEKL
jgi:putative FmdB family regulatory protein